MDIDLTLGNLSGPRTGLGDDDTNAAVQVANNRDDDSNRGDVEPGDDGYEPSLSPSEVESVRSGVKDKLDFNQDDDGTIRVDKADSNTPNQQDDVAAQRLRAEREQLREEIRDVRRRRNQWKEEAKRRKEAVREARRQAGKNSREYQQAKQELDQAEQQIQAYENQIDNYQQKISELESQMKQLQKQNQELKQGVQASQQKNQQLRKGVKKLQQALRAEQNEGLTDHLRDNPRQAAVVGGGVLGLGYLAYRMGGGL